LVLIFQYVFLRIGLAKIQGKQKYSSWIFFFYQKSSIAIDMEDGQVMHRYKNLNKLNLQSHRGTKEMKARRKENNAIFKQIPGYKVTFSPPFDPLK